MEMETVSPETFCVVLNEDGNPFIQDSHLLLQHKQSGTLHFVNASEDFKKMFSIDEWDISHKNISESSSTSSSFASSSSYTPSISSVKRMKWSRSAILKLIELRQKYDEQFQSTTKKNDSVWQQLATDMQQQDFEVTPVQCQDKWKYLKCNYNAKKDNMSSRCTGEKTIRFEFFSEMDEFLGKKHNVQPVALASSIKGDTIPVVADISGAADEHDEPAAAFGETPKKKLKSNVVANIKNKQKKDSFNMYFQDMKERAENRESNRDRRHQETIEVKNRALEVFGQKMDALLDRLCPKNEDPKKKLE
ncbi:hypothetical protein FQR65_LT15981 [Abscondita terminalis]|nr:hypothetical protein FQR65_LT15981 [Abscondita terminalis]